MGGSEARGEPLPVASKGGIVLFSAMTGVLVVIAAVSGLLLSLYITLVVFRVIGPDAGWIPRACRIGEDTCRLVLDHPDGRVLGVPNSLPGLLYYGGVCFAAAAGFPASLLVPMLVASWVAAGFSLYLTYSLVFRVRALCVLCIVSHVLNLALAVLFTAGSV